MSREASCQMLVSRKLPQAGDVREHSPGTGPWALARRPKIAPAASWHTATSIVCRGCMLHGPEPQSAHSQRPIETGIQKRCWWGSVACLGGSVNTEALAIRVAGGLAALHRELPLFFDAVVWMQHIHGQDGTSSLSLRYQMSASTGQSRRGGSMLDSAYRAGGLRCCKGS